MLRGVLTAPLFIGGDFLFEITSNNDIRITRGDTADLTVSLLYKATENEPVKNYIAQNGDKIILTVKENADTEEIVFQLTNTCNLYTYTKWKDYYKGDETHIGGGEANIYLGEFIGGNVYSFTRIPILSLTPKIIVKDLSGNQIDLLSPEIKFINNENDKYYQCDLDLSKYKANYKVFLWYDTSVIGISQTDIFITIESGLIINIATAKFQTFNILPSHTKNLGYDNYKYDIQLIVKGVEENDEIYTVVPYKNFRICPEITW